MHETNAKGWINLNQWDNFFNVSLHKTAFLKGKTKQFTKFAFIINDIYFWKKKLFAYIPINYFLVF